MTSTSTHPRLQPYVIDAGEPLRLAVIGCGDVVLRRCVPGLAAITDLAHVVACCDPLEGRAELAVREFGRSAPEPETFADYRAMLDHVDVDGVLDLTPGPQHFEVNHAVLEAGRHLYTEKPLAGSVSEGQQLVRRAQENGLLLMAAPAAMATPRFRWIGALLRAGRIGTPTLTTAHLADLGPAGWRAYTGDPSVFYGPDVGTLLDQGIYLLHMVTGLLGPARRVEAMGAVTMPRRTVLGGPALGQTIEVGTPDHMLIHLDFGGTAFGEILSSYAVAASKMPTLEVHCTAGSVSMRNHLSAAGAVSVYSHDDSPFGIEGWIDDVAPWSHPPTDDVVGLGPIHFVSCLRGEEDSILTGEHACHVLEITDAVSRSIQQGRAIELQTMFETR